jgi:hypothetical protein
MALIDDTKLALSDIDEVDVHVFGSEEEHVLILAQLHGGDVIPSEGTQVVLLHEDPVVSSPDPQVSVLGA